jgi:hypothetical protein
MFTQDRGLPNASGESIRRKNPCAFSLFSVVKASPRFSSSLISSSGEAIHVYTLFHFKPKLHYILRIEREKEEPCEVKVCWVAYTFLSLIYKYKTTAALIIFLSRVQEQAAGVELYIEINLIPSWF